MTRSRAPAEPRADVRAATDALAAARGDALRAKASLVPRLNGFARYDWNSPTGLYAGDRNWTVGVMASWNPFAGASELADVRSNRRPRAGRASAGGSRACERATRDRADAHGALRRAHAARRSPNARLHRARRHTAS